MAAPRKLYKVADLMRHAGVSRQTVHNYTMLGLIRPVERTESGHRLYDETVFERLRRIKLLTIHRTLEEVRDILVQEDKEEA